MENSENKYSFAPTILKALIERGPDFLTELFRLAMNEAMKLERENFLNAGAYERSKNRLDYANGFKPRTLNMRSGRGAFAIPQTRNDGFPAIPWRRRYFHLCQNAQSYARKPEERKDISRTMRDIFSRCGKDNALVALRGAVQYWNDTKRHSRFAEWLEDNAEESMTHFDFDEGWWRRIRASNRIERLNKEIKKRTKVVGVFPNPESCERLVGSLLMEQHDEWMEGKAYLTGKNPLFAHEFTEKDLHNLACIESIRQKIVATRVFCSSIMENSK